MKTYKDLLLEMPYINPYHTKSRLEEYRNHISELIEDNHHSATKIGENSYHQHQYGQDFYYHHIDGHPREINVVKNNVQIFAHKGTGTSSKNHEFMLHHVKVHKTLKSDDQHTPGSKKLWKDFIHRNTKLKFHHVDEKKTTEINSSNLASHDDKIWPKSSYDNSYIKADHV